MHAPHTCAWPTWWPAAPCSAAAPTSAALPWFSSPISSLVLAARAAFFPVCAAESGSSARTRGHPPPSAPRTPTMQKRAGAWDADGHARVRRALQTHTAAECAHTIRAHRGDLRCAAGRRHPSRPTITPFSHLSRPSLPDFLLTLTSTSLVDATNLFTTKKIAIPEFPGTFMAIEPAKAHKCGVCGEDFPSKNKLFKHLKDGGCCARLAAGADAPDASRHLSKKPRLAETCGRVQVSIASLDSDVEPDDCLLPEKLRIIRLAGIDPDAPITICGCSSKAGKAGPGGGDPAGTIPRDLLRALRVLAMTETEVYFAGGPDESAWAASECKGMSVRNEIRALNHLRKLVRANDASYKAKRVCRQGLLDLVARMIAEVYSQHLPPEKGLPISDPADRSACERFEKWSKEAGISASLCLREFASSGRGMAAGGDLKQGQIILTTPASVFLNTGALEKSRFAHVFRAVQGLDERAQHILLLLMEYGDRESSPWRYYLESCPASFDNALTMTLEEIKELEGSPALECLIQHRQDAENLFSVMFPALSDAFPHELPPTVRSWERFVWAAALIDTRAWATEAGSQVTSLVPVADMMNHHVCAQGEVQRFREEEGEVRVQMLTDVKQGQQVYVFYGALSTASQLVLA